MWLTLLLLFTLLQLKRYLTKPAPGPLGIPILGYLNAIYRGITDTTIKNDLFTLVHQYGDIFHFDVNGTDIIFMNNPDDIQYVLDTKFSSFVRGPKRREEFYDLLGSGIFNADGDVWKFHRRIAKPIFREAYLFKVMYPTFVKEVKQFLMPMFDKAAESGEYVDLLNVFSSYTMRTFLNVGLGAELKEDEIEQFNQAFNFLLHVISMRDVKPLWKYTERRDEIEAARESINEIIDRAIERNAVDDAEKIDIMSNFYSDESSTKEEIREGFLNFMIAGRDTTGACATWAMYTLLEECGADVREKLEEECGRFSLDLPPEETIQLDYLQNFIKEVLRLHPSVPIDARHCIKQETLPSGVVVKPKTTVMYSQFISGRTLWDDPLTVNPDRWLDESSFHKYLFTAFHGGPQICLGKKMAFLELSVMIATVINNYNLELQDPSAGQSTSTNIILGPIKPLRVKVSKK
eukprot:TRINITY_DN6012_c1_g1_i1.p1 TRINITY_DN6012_c1_g1~~TRINITY_DN6012_c1_g1_i1.p1  ORF type:complete len:462 (-),score=91.34 TRINITY_DN6012_c1_g1_i1:49-1434(-)